MFLINMNGENCILIIFFTMVGLVAYIILAIGFLAVSLQKTFESYNLKFEHLKEIILNLEIKDKKVKKKKNGKKEKKFDKD